MDVWLISGFCILCKAPPCKLLCIHPNTHGLKCLHVYIHLDVEWVGLASLLNTCSVIFLLGGGHAILTSCGHFVGSRLHVLNNCCMIRHQCLPVWLVYRGDSLWFNLHFLIINEVQHLLIDLFVIWISFLVTFLFYFFPYRFIHSEFGFWFSNVGGKYVLCFLLFILWGPNEQKFLIIM